MEKHESNDCQSSLTYSWKEQDSHGNRLAFKHSIGIHESQADQSTPYHTLHQCDNQVTPSAVNNASKVQDNEEFHTSTKHIFQECICSQEHQSVRRYGLKQQDNHRIKFIPKFPFNIHDSQEA